MPAATWNGKFEGVGSGGSLGSIGYTALADGLKRGYATMANDNGHTGNMWTFAQFPEQVIDFGYRAQHVTTQFGKRVTAEFYGAAPQHSYFVGCSQGDHHALMELQPWWLSSLLSVVSPVLVAGAGGAEMNVVKSIKTPNVE